MLKNKTDMNQKASMDKISLCGAVKKADFWIGYISKK